MFVLPLARGFSSSAAALGNAAILLLLLFATAPVHSQIVLPDLGDSNFKGCAPAISIMNSCVSEDVRFATVTDHSSQAACACYTSSTWAPTVFNSAYKSCLSYYVTAIPSVYKQLTSDIGTGLLCSSVLTAGAIAVEAPGPRTLPPPAAAAVAAQQKHTPVASGGAEVAAATPVPPSTSFVARGLKPSYYITD